MELIVDDRVQTLIDAAFAVEEVIEKVVGFVPIKEIFANRRVAKVWRKAAFRALRSKGFVYTVNDAPTPVKNDLKEFEEKFSVDCYIPLETALGVSDDNDSLLALSKNYSKFVIGLSVKGIPANFQCEYSELGAFPRLEYLHVYYHSDHLHKTDPTAKFLSKIVHNSKYFKDFHATVSIESGMDEGHLPWELTSLHAYTKPSFPIPDSCLGPTHLPNIKVLTLHIIADEENEPEERPGIGLQKRIKTILEKFSPQLEEFSLNVDGEHVLPYLRLPKMDKLQKLVLQDVLIESADASKPLPQLLPKLKTLKLEGLKETVFGNMAALLPGENHGLEELTLSFPFEKQWELVDEIEDGGVWEGFPPLIRNLKALKSLILNYLPLEMDLAVWFDAFHALPSLNKLSFQGALEIDPALIEAWTSAGRQIDVLRESGWQLAAGNFNYARIFFILD